MEQWFVVTDADGKPYSYGTVVAETLPAGFTARPLSDDELAALPFGPQVMEESGN